MTIAKARARALTAVTCLFGMLFAAPAGAADPPVTVGEVAARVTRADIDLPKVVRTAFEREIGALAIAPRRDKYVLSASVVRLDGECVISAVLREKKSGAIRAMIQGNARSGGDGSTETAIGTVEAAVRGAAQALPRALP